MSEEKFTLHPAWEAYWKLEVELTTMTEQRDRLAEALDRLERTAGLAALQDDPARVQARQALAAVKGGSDD